MDKDTIRTRDRYYFTKENGVIPEGYCMHHLYYSEEYDKNSFVIVTKEEHDTIHGFKTTACSSGVDSHAKHLDYCKQYYIEHADKYKEYRDAHKQETREYGIKYREEHKEEIKVKRKEKRDMNRDEINRRQRENYKRRKYREKLIAMGVI